MAPTTGRAVMRVGVLELLIPSVSSTRIDGLHNRSFKRYLASITPQVVATWCSQLGHEVHYATYYGQDNPHELLPDRLDVIFLSAFTHASALAYALAKLYRKDHTLTVIGGPHARAFPLDCMRFFDLVVHDCDKALVDDILRGQFEPPAVITTGRPLIDVPTVEERMPYIRRATFTDGRRRLLTNVPILTSVGCPYRCNFCVDWKNPFTVLPTDRLKADLEYVATHLPRVIIGYHDPNFAVKFDAVMDVLDTIPKRLRSPYVIESSLSILKGDRVRRLRETNCAYLMPGIESWADYSEKAGVGSITGAAKLERVVAQFRELHKHVGGLGAGFVFGTDADAGDEPLALTAEFVRQVPFVWPQMNIPMPYGGTPLFDTFLAEGRILPSMPFSFFYTPYLVTLLRNYTPREYYERLIALYDVVTSANVFTRRLTTTRGFRMRLIQVLRTLSMTDGRFKLRRVWRRLLEDEQYQAYHEGRSLVLPEFYRREYWRRLGPYAEFMTDADMSPELG